jgi:hypothetical protein
MHEKGPWMVRVIFWLPFPRRYTRAQYAELYRLLGSETRALMRRPIYIVGLLVSGGLALYLVLAGIATGARDWSLVGMGVLVAFGHLCGVNSVREHLCERLLRLREHPDELEGV